MRGRKERTIEQRALLNFLSALLKYLTHLDKQVHACRALSVQIKNLNCDSVNY